MRTVQIEDHAADARADFRHDERRQRTGKRHPCREDGIALDPVAERAHGEIGQKTIKGLKDDEQSENKSSVRHGLSPCNRRAHRRGNDS